MSVVLEVKSLEVVCEVLKKKCKIDISVVIKRQNS